MSVTTQLIKSGGVTSYVKLRMVRFSNSLLSLFHSKRGVFSFLRCLLEYLSKSKGLLNSLLTKASN